MDPKLHALILELEKRSISERVINDLFAEQKAVATSNGKKLAVRCSRRSGKSYTILSMMFSQCIRKPKSRCLYLALTYDNTKGIVFSTVQELNEKYGLKLKINKATLTIEFPNKSMIECKGADTSVMEADKFAGSFYDIICIDEAASFRPNTLDYLIDEVLEQTLIDTDGVIILAGSPRPVEDGRFYEIATNKGNDIEFFAGKVDDWEVHAWDTFKNPHVAANWKKKIDEKIAANPEIIHTAAFKRNYLGIWATDLNDVVYKISEINYIDKAPEPYNPRYICGIDFGFNDDTAFVIGCINQNDPTFYVLESYSASKLGIDEIVRKLNEYRAKYKNVLMVSDTNEKIVVHEIGKRYGIGIVPAKKTNKYGEEGWISIMNNDFLFKKIMIVEPNNKQYIAEAKKLTWVKGRNGEIKEDPNVPNHLQDAALYAYRYSYHYLEKEKKLEPLEDRIFNEVLKKHKELADKSKNWRRTRNY